METRQKGFGFTAETKRKVSNIKTQIVTIY